VDQPTVNDNLENAAARLDEFGFGGEALPESGRQTGGSVVVVSHATVFDADLHQGVLSPSGG